MFTKDISLKVIHFLFQGRGGLGSIFVWAAGNGGRSHDSCNCDGYAVSPYTISVGSVSERDNKPWYLEMCSSTLTSTYSSGDQSEKQIVSFSLCLSLDIVWNLRRHWAGSFLALGLVCEAVPHLHLTQFCSIPALVSVQFFVPYHFWECKMNPSCMCMWLWLDSNVDII